VPAARMPASGEISAIEKKKKKKKNKRRRRKGKK
jgi:hypothetical protein